MLLTFRNSPHNMAKFDKRATKHVENKSHACYNRVATTVCDVVIQMLFFFFAFKCTINVGKHLLALTNPVTETYME